MPSTWEGTALYNQAESALLELLVKQCPPPAPSGFWPAPAPPPDAAFPPAGLGSARFSSSATDCETKLRREQEATFKLLIVAAVLVLSALVFAWRAASTAPSRAPSPEVEAALLERAEAAEAAAEKAEATIEKRKAAHAQARAHDEEQAAALDADIALLHAKVAELAGAEKARLAAEQKQRSLAATVAEQRQRAERAEAQLQRTLGASASVSDGYRSASLSPAASPARSSVSVLSSSVERSPSRSPLRSPGGSSLHSSAHSAGGSPGGIRRAPELEAAARRYEEQVKSMFGSLLRIPEVFPAVDP